MIARLQRCLLVILTILAGAWWWGSASWEIPTSVRMALLVLVVMPHLAVLAIEFALLHRFGASEPASPPTAGQLAGAWWGEVVAAIKVFGWYQPFRSMSQDDLLDSTGTKGRRGLVLVHGYLCNRGLWTPWLKVLREMDVPFVAVNLEPVFGSIDDYPPIVERAVHRLEQATGVKPVIVAHSMGGLAVRAWMKQTARPSQRIASVITIATPHRGTWLARFGVSRNARQMRRHGAWIAELEHDEPDEIRALFTCYFGHCDNIVFPAATATLAGADNRHLPGVAHLDMLNDPRVLASVLDRLVE